MIVIILKKCGDCRIIGHRKLEPAAIYEQLKLRYDGTTAVG
jgi:hypothetical protein